MKKILYSICLILSLATVSCANLDLNPLSEGSSNNWYSSQEELEMSLSDLYRRDFFPIDDIMWADDFPSRGSTTFTQNSSLTATN